MVADVGCGHGESTILMAQAYPRSRFFGFDSHPRSIEPPPEIVRYGARFGGDEQQDREAAE